MPTLKGISDFALFTSLTFLLVDITVTIMIFYVRLYYLHKITASHKWPTDWPILVEFGSIYTYIVLGFFSKPLLLQNGPSVENGDGAFWCRMLAFLIPAQL